MSKFKTNDKLKIYYFDTDAVDIETELDLSEIGSELGQMKLEHIFEDAIFLCPKVYAGKAKDYEYVRVKGLKNPIKFNEFIPLLQKDQKIEISQEKWFKDMSNGIFNVKDEIYTLMITGKKRKLLYNNDNIFYDTLPLRLDNGKIID